MFNETVQKDNSYKYINGSDMRALNDSYLPDSIIGRDNQIDEINKSIEQFNKFGNGTNLIITGRTGTGKTVILKSLVRNNDFFRYASGVVDNTEVKVLRRIAMTNKTYRDIILNSLIKQLHKEPKCIVIDEVDKVKDFKNLVNTLNYIYRETEVPIILATNVSRLVSMLPDDARLTLFFRPINFGVYNATELRNILQDRIKRANINLDDGKISLISALATGEGSARVLLGLARECIFNNNFEVDFMKSIVEKYTEGETAEHLSSGITYSARKMLNIIYELISKSKEGITSSGEIYDCYQEDNTPITRGRISQILDSLEYQGLISTNNVNRGRMGGRSRLISYDQRDKSIIERIIK